MSTLQGAWVWYELMTPDPDAAKIFYEAVVGWSITPPSLQTNGYGFIANADGGMTGGVLGLTGGMLAGGARPGWLGYVGVDDCDAALTAIEAAGGKVLMPATDVPGAGRIAMVADCCGTPFYVMTPRMPEGATGESTAFSPHLVGRCSWNELVAADQQAALAFYTGQFGWALPEPMDMGDWGKYQFTTHDGVVTGAIMQKPPQFPAAAWNHYFRVADIDTALAAAQAHGGQIVNGPNQVPTGDWIINGIDPQGAPFALVGRKAET